MEIVEARHVQVVQVAMGAMLLDVGSDKFNQLIPGTDANTRRHAFIVAHEYAYAVPPSYNDKSSRG